MSMKPSRDMKKFVSYSLVFYFLWINPALDLILCWSESGHVALEPAKQSDICCTHEERVENSPVSSLHTPLTQPPTESECMPCSDIQLAFGLDYEVVRHSDPKLFDSSRSNGWHDVAWNHALFRAYRVFQPPKPVNPFGSNCHFDPLVPTVLTTHLLN